MSDLKLDFTSTIPLPDGSIREDYFRKLQEKILRERYIADTIIDGFVDNFLMRQGTLPNYVCQGPGWVSVGYVIPAASTRVDSFSGLKHLTGSA